MGMYRSVTFPYLFPCLSTMAPAISLKIHGYGRRLLSAATMALPRCLILHRFKGPAPPPVGFTEDQAAIAVSWGTRQARIPNVREGGGADLVSTGSSAADTNSTRSSAHFGLYSVTPVSSPTAKAPPNQIDRVILFVCSCSKGET
jgi:hypothetical protein